jgi:hypothetical protein
VRAVPIPIRCGQRRLALRNLRLLVLVAVILQAGRASNVAEMTESEFAQLVESLVKQVIAELRKLGISHGSMPRLH